MGDIIFEELRSVRDWEDLEERRNPGFKDEIEEAHVWKAIEYLMLGQTTGG